MNYPRKKISLLMGALIIGQAVTIQNMHGMDTIGNYNTEDDANMVYDFYSNALSSLYNKLTNLYSDMSNKVNENEFIKTAIQQKMIAVKDECTELYNAVTRENQYKTKPGFRFIPGIGVCDALKDGANALYNYDYDALYNNASTQGHALYNQASDKVITLKNELDERASTLYNNASTQGHTLYNQASNKVITLKNGVNNGASTLYNNVSTWAPPFHNNLREAASKDFWVRALPIVQNDAIQYQNDTVQYIENIPNVIEGFAKDKIKNKIADALELNNNDPVNVDVIVDTIAKKTVLSLTKYTIAVSAALFATYKTCMYGINKYQAYQKELALDESIKQHLTDEKKAEITQVIGKELSDDDIQELINTIKTHATSAEDSCATQAIVDLVIKEYVAKQINV